jgi:8-oxo-dGTP pyrophosphatase MutT (NUDIX family)
MEKEIDYDKLNMCISTVSVIVEREFNGKKQIMVQIRNKPSVDPVNSGKIEIPSGIIERYENAIDCAIKEVREESGVKISKEDFGSKEYEIFTNNNDDILVGYEPFYVSQQLKGGRSYLNIGLICRLGQKGGFALIENQNETKDPRWIDMDELQDLLNNSCDEIFPLNIPILVRYLDLKTNG